VILPTQNTSKIDVIEWKINGVNQCPACGEKVKSKGLISGGKEASVIQWPWHVSLWRQSQNGINYICGATILNKKWIITAGEL
jgi:secreted trypsin-like serine protease